MLLVSFRLRFNFYLMYSTLIRVFSFLQFVILFLFKVQHMLSICGKIWENVMSGSMTSKMAGSGGSQVTMG